jgi:acyl carrier protein
MVSASIEEIKKLVGLQLGKRSVKESDRLVEDLGAESSDVANVVAALEEKYGITLKESEIARISTPTDLYKLINQRLNEIR